MARAAGRTQPSAPRERGRLLVPRSQFVVELQNRIERGVELRDASIQNRADLDQNRAAYYTWTEYNAQLLKRRFSTDELHEEYVSSVGIYVLGSSTLQQDVEEHRDDVSTKIRKLASIGERVDLYEEPAPNVSQVSRADSSARADDIFLVHGRADGPKQEVARFILEVVDRSPVILHEQVSGGMTVIEKLEHHAGRIGFAIVILTGDDEGRLKGTDDVLLPRGRENVVLELGFFIGRLDRSRVVLLHESDVTLPSDVLGVVYVRLDNAGGWKLALARELKAAGYPVDASKMI